MREPGFYWVRVRDSGRVEVARFYTDGYGETISRLWYLTGWDGFLDETDVTVISERLSPPVDT